MKDGKDCSQPGVMADKVERAREATTRVRLLAGYSRKTSDAQDIDDALDALAAELEAAEGSLRRSQSRQGTYWQSRYERQLSLKRGLHNRLVAAEKRTAELESELAREKAGRSIDYDALRALPPDLPIQEALDLMDRLKAAGRKAGEAALAAGETPQ